MPTLLDPLLRARDRLLSDPRFQHWAARFPLTRPVARRRARAVFDLCAGFVYSQTLLACVELKLFEILASGPQQLDDLARRLNLPPSSARRLLEAAASLDLASKRGPDRYGLDKHGAAMLANPGIARMIEHHAMLYRDMADPVALLKDPSAATHLRRYWGYAEHDTATALPAEATKAYTSLMSASQSLVAAEVLAAYPIARHQRVLDIGGGDGTFLCRLATAAPALELMLFDLPSVAESARNRFANAGLSERARIFSGNFHTDPLPKGADLITLSRIIHDHDDGPAQHLLASARTALADGGTLLVAEPMSGTRGAEPMGEAYFGFYLMAMGSGRPRTAQELTSMLTKAGFSRTREIKTAIPLQTRIIVATT